MAYSQSFDYWVRWSKLCVDATAVFAIQHQPQVQMRPQTDVPPHGENIEVLKKEAHLYQFVVQMMFVLGIMMEGPDPTLVWCVNPTELATISHPSCGAQGMRLAGT